MQPVHHRFQANPVPVPSQPMGQALGRFGLVSKDQFIRFGSKDHKPSEEACPVARTWSLDEIKALGDKVYWALKDREFDRAGGLEALITHLIGADRGIAEKLMEVIQRRLQEIPIERIYENTQDENGRLLRIGTKQSPVEFRERLNMYSSQDTSFEEFLEEYSGFGKEKPIIVTLTGWTNPPGEYFLRNKQFRTMYGYKSPFVEDADRKKLKKDAEEFYVTKLTDMLEKIYQQLKDQHYSDAQIKDKVVFLYGSTPEGVDLAIEKFCDKKGLKYAGVTCDSWLKYLPDKGNKKPIYVAPTPDAFARLLADYSDFLVVTGGRSYAANVRDRYGEVQSKRAFLAVDVMGDNEIRIPSKIPIGDDISKSRTENAAADLMGDDDSNPEKLVKRLRDKGIHKPAYVSNAEFYLAYEIAREINSRAGKGSLHRSDIETDSRTSIQ